MEAVISADGIRAPAVIYPLGQLQNCLEGGGSEELYMTVGNLSGDGLGSSGMAWDRRGWPGTVGDGWGRSRTV